MACDDHRFISRGFPAPPLPEDFPMRLGRLEDRSGLLLEEFARELGLREQRPGEWRRGMAPTAVEVWAIMQSACRVHHGLAVMLSDCSQPRRPGGAADDQRPRTKGACGRVPDQHQEGRTVHAARPSCVPAVTASFPSITV